MNSALTFYASRGKALLLILGSAAFVALGFFIKPEHPIAGWAGILFFSLGIPAGLYSLLPKAVYLRLDEQGFEMNALFKRKARVAWHDVDGFQLGAIGSARMIFIAYAPHYEAQKLARSASQALAGVDGGISNVYNAPLEKGFEALVEWHRRFGSSDRRAPGERG